MLPNASEYATSGLASCDEGLETSDYPSLPMRIHSISEHPHVKMRSYSSGLQVYSNTCRHVDETTDMSYPERDQSAQTLLSKWVLTWLLEWGGSPEGEGEPSSSCPAPIQGGRQAELGGPQQPPHSRRYSDTLEKDTQPAYPTDAKEREKSRRKALKAQGKAHVVRKRAAIVEDHF